MEAIHYSKLAVLCEREDRNGNKVPFSMVYVARTNGRVVVADDVVTLSVDPVRKTRNVRYTDRAKGEVVERTIRDCLLVEVNGVAVDV